MRQASGLLVMLLMAQAYSAPQFITFKDGKLGVNFGGYHANVGVGGMAGTGSMGGLYAEAGTPHGQSAVAGLGGAIGTKGNAGGLYAGAQAAENVHASAVLGGISGGHIATGSGLATAQAGGNVASYGLGGQTSAAGSTGYKVQSFEIPATVVKETEVSVAPVEYKPTYTTNTKIHKEIKFEADNEVKPVPLTTGVDTYVNAKVDVKAEAQPSTFLVKEVYVEPRPHIIQKTKIRTHYKPHHHHVHKAYIGGYIGGGADISPPSYSAVQKRIDLGVAGSENVGVVDVGAYGSGGAQTTITKEVTVGRNPTFFSDIFNIPISTLQAVGNFLSNSAANTKVSVQKSASVQAAPDSDTTSSKHAPLSSSSSSSTLSDTQISVETPSFSQIIDGIFSIPINTLGAVNKFLENNVSGRKRIQVQEGTGEPTRLRLGPHARKRASKVVYVEKEISEAQDATKLDDAN